MLEIRYTRFFSLLLSFALLIAPLPLTAMAENVISAVSQNDVNYLIKDSDDPYIYLGKELSNISDVIIELSNLDNDLQSPLIHLKKHIENGLVLTRYNNIINVLQRAEEVLNRSYKALDPLKAQQLWFDLDNSINQVIDGMLSVEISRCFDENSKRSFANIITVKGLLSVNDQIVQNITATNLSATDSILQNATIAHLSVTDPIVQNLVATNLSVVEGTITGTLSVNDEIIRDFLRFNDFVGGEYVGLRAPTTVPTSYTLSLPSTSPTVGQFLRANNTTPTNLEWTTLGGSVSPVLSKSIYVSKIGNDSTGNGSLSAPYATLSKAITIGNSIASSMNPISIQITSGIYVEDNSAGPLTITSDGISIVGVSPSSVIIVPNTPTNNFLLINNNIHMSDITFQSPAPLATGIILATGNLTVFNNVRIFNFLTGISCLGGLGTSYGFTTCFFVNNGTAININNAYVELDNSTIFGTSNLSAPSINTAITATGANAHLAMNGGVCGVCATGMNISGNANASFASVAFRLNTFDIIQNGASHLTLTACTFELTSSSSDIDIQVSGTGTLTKIISCEFSGSGLLGVPEGTAIEVTDDASVSMSSGSMYNYTTGISIGTSSDTSSTSLSATALVIQDCTTDIIQQGSTTLNFNASTASGNKISINDETNVSLAFFDLNKNNALTIGSTANVDTVLIQAAVNPSDQPIIAYKSSLYSSQAIGLENFLNTPSSWFALSNHNANLSSITTDRSKIAQVSLFSDTGSPTGGTSALRGWNINKKGFSAELSFNYQNSDSSGQPLIPEYTLMQLDGVNNQVQLPAINTQLLFGNDTNLYRSAANILKTDDNFIVGTLTPGRAIATNSITNQLISSTTTTTELGFLSGVTSSVQTQLNNKVSRSGDSMTGPLTMLTQNPIRLSDAIGNYVGLNAPLAISSNYTLSLPATSPVPSQTLRAGGVTATNLEWVTEGGAILPAMSETIYVTKYGNDITGNGSFDNPYASLSKAIITANSLASSSSPIAILIGPGNYIEDNSAGPLTITAHGIAIMGDAANTTSIIPNTLSHDLLLINNTVIISNITFVAQGVSTATGISLAAGNFSNFNNIQVINFQTGVRCAGGGDIYIFNNSLLLNNGTGLLVNNTNVQCNSCILFGSLGSSVTHIGANITGAGSVFVMSGGSSALCATAININDNASATVNAATFKFNNMDIAQSGASKMTLSSCSFEVTNNPTDVNIEVSGAGTLATLVGCEFNGNNILGTPEATGIFVHDNGSIQISSTRLKNYTTALHIGVPTDTNSTILTATGLTIRSCTHDVIQEGSSLLNLNASTLSSDKIIVNDPTHVTLAIFDLDDNNSLTIGSTADQDTSLVQVDIDPINHPGIEYRSSLYATQALGFDNTFGSSSSLYSLSANNTDIISITTDRTKIAGLRLVSDEGSPIGGTSALRGWDINKNGSAAALSFTYQNSDIVGQSAISPYIVMQLDGVNNQLQLPTVGTQIVFDADTNLYRSAANVLKTDDNFIVGTLIPDRAVITNAGTNQLASSTATGTELGYVSGVTSSIQTQLNNKVNKTGDSMSGALNMLTQNSVRFQDLVGNYVGINAQATIPSSYTLSLPTTIPTVNQTLRAGTVTPTNLEWVTDGGAIVPSVSETIYVTQYGNDITGDGSFTAPYASLSKAISVANTIASAANPVSILISAGIYIENNSTGPLTITADGISIIGAAATAVTIMPSTPANDLLFINNTVQITDITFQSSSPLATGISLTAGNLSAIVNTRFINFQTGVECSGGATQFYGFDICIFVNNSIGLRVNDTRVGVIGCSFFGVGSILDPSANTGISVTGAGTNLSLDGGVCAQCDNAINITGNATANISAMTFRLNTFTIIQDGASHMILNGSTIASTNSASDIELQISGAGTVAEISGCQFNGNSLLGVPQATCLLVSDNATVNLSSESIINYTTGIHIGLPADTSSTVLNASSTTITNCTTDILQEGSSTLNFNSGVASANNMVINDSTNVIIAIFDIDDNNALTIGSLSDEDTSLIQAAINNTTHPELQYKSSLYSTQAIGLFNPLSNPSSLFVQSQDNADLTAITTDRTDIAGIRLVSDTASPIGGTSALRGWDINKNGSTAELSFTYQNNDIVGQSAISPYVVMQLDGVNNQLQLPTAGTQIIFDADTNLYRSAANVLKTDDNFIVGTLTPDRAVITNAVTNQLASSIVTSTELGFLSGVTSPIQTQLNGKVSKTGDTMTGALQLPAGTAAAPSLRFTGSTTTGLSAPAANILSFDINGTEKMKINSSGITIDGFAAPGVVHNDATGLLSTSLIVDTDITNATISNAKLATISSSNTSGNIVARDGSGNFVTNMITLTGSVLNNTDAATKAYVDSAISTGIVAKTPAIVVSITNETLSGLSTIDGVTLTAGDRVLLTGQTNPVENGLWVADSGAWTRPADFATGTTAGQAYVLILSGAIEAGSAWLCNTPTAIIDTDPLGFALFSLPDTTTGSNVGVGIGLIFRDKTGSNINLKSLIQGSHIVITNNTNDITLATDATNSNTASTIVARDASGNFSAGTITANLTGAASLNVLKTGDTMTGTLQLPAGTAASPSLKFTGSTNTGLSAATANVLSFDISGTEQMNISSSGVTIDGFTTAGVVHNDATGLLSSSLIVNADVDPAAAIVDTKLATISTAGKVANSATTATSANTANTIVARDASGNFNAGTIVASLTGAASANVLKAGDTMTGALQLPAGTTAAPSLVFTGSTTTGLSTSAGALSFSTNALERLKIASGGAISVNAFTTAGIVHNDASGNLSSSLIVNGDVAPAAGIVDTKLATISTAGKVANSATTATNANTANAIVTRDASGNFSAGTITASLTGAASLNVLKSGDTMTGALQLPAGTAAAPSLRFTGSTTTGLSVANPDTLSFDISGTEQMNISASGVTIDGFTTAGVVHNDSLGLLSSALIVNADVSASAGIVDTKLATISTAGKVANSATTATNTNTASAIVARDASGNFSASTITASLTGAASANVLKVGDTMTGTLQLPTGTTALPSLVFTGSATSGLSASAGALSLSTSGIERLKIASGGAISVDAFTTAGVVHNDSSGNLSSSLIVNADVDPTAAIIDTKLATISTPGKVANSATTATNANTANAIVARDSSGNFTAGTITASLTGNVTGAASLNVLKAGDTMTGGLQLPAGTTAAPSLKFTGSTTTGISVPTANTLSFDIDGAEQMNISSSGVTIDGFTTAGIVHNDSSGLLSSSLIVNSDVDPAAAIVDTKLATISTAGKVANSATTATNTNTASAIVARDASGNFSASTITASLTGAASANLLKAGDTMTGTLQLPAGTTALPSLVFTGSATSGLSANAGALSLSTAGIERLKIASGGAISVDAFTTAGVVHNDSSGNLSSSLIVNADVDPAAGIVDTKLGTISTAGKVANSATTATSANTANAIVARDSSGNFSAGSITASLTGAASLNVLKAGDIMTGNLQLPAGTTAAPSLTFTGAITSGLSAGANSLSLSTAAAERLKISSGGTISVNAFTTAGVVHNDASGNLSSSLIVNSDVDPAAAIVDTKLATISTAGKVANSATTATSTNTPNTIVLRDASGNFSAGTITANLSGNATTATIATNFSGSLSGDVTGTQSATVVSSVGGQTASNVAAATVLANAATSANSANTIVKRGATGNFSAGAISVTDTVISNTATITPFNTAGIVHNNTSGLLSSSLIVNADVDPAAGIVDTKLATISTAGKVANSATTATSANTVSAIVARDASGNFSAGTITANLSGNATTATTATNFTGSLSGDVTGTQSATVVNTVGGQTAANVAAATVLANAATSVNTASAIVRRTATGGFSAGAISVSDEVVSNALTVTPFSTAGVVHNNASGLLSSSLIVNADVDPAAAIVDTKLATISTAGKVANSATTATSANTASAIVARDASGNFSAGTITASLSGNATTATTATNFSGSLAGEVTGTQGATVVSNAVGTNTANAIVRRTATGGFSAGAISVTDVVASGNLNLTTDPSTSSAGNILKNGISFIHDFGSNNTFVGINAGNFTMTGTDNIGVGPTVLQNNSLGSFNIGIGSSALAANTTGNNNIGIGGFALGVNTIGTNNTAIGTSALLSNTTGNLNTAVGAFALTNNSTGTGNTAVGTQALQSNTIGTNNTAFGTTSLNANTTGINNTALGAGSLASNTIGAANTGIGRSSLVANTTGINNTAIGSNSLSAVTSGSTNIAIGSGSGGTLTTGSGNIYINANASAAAEANTTRIGTSQTACFVQGIFGATTPTGTPALVAVDSTGKLGTATLTSTSANTANTIVQRSATGGFSVGAISMTDGIISNTLTITPFSTAGVVHNSAAGLLSSSLIVNADVDPTAAIVDTKLATISTAGKVANSATTATSANTANAIVARDASGNFSAGTITASLTGSASNNVLKAGDTMTGTLQLPAGTAAAPSFKFTGSTNTGISAATANRISFDTNGIERMAISTTTINTAAPLIIGTLFGNTSTESFTITANGQSFAVAATTSILILSTVANRTGFTVTFPSSPTNGQYFTIMTTSINSIALINDGNGATVANGITSLDANTGLNANTGGASVTYYYLSSTNTWYRFLRG